MLGHNTISGYEGPLLDPGKDYFRVRLSISVTGDVLLVGSLPVGTRSLLDRARPLLVRVGQLSIRVGCS